MNTSDHADEACCTLCSPHAQMRCTKSDLCLSEVRGSVKPRQAFVKLPAGRALGIKYLRLEKGVVRRLWDGHSIVVPSAQ